MVRAASRPPRRTWSPRSRWPSGCSRPRRRPGPGRGRRRGAPAAGPVPGRAGQPDTACAGRRPQLRGDLRRPGRRIPGRRAGAELVATQVNRIAAVMMASTWTPAARCGFWSTPPARRPGVGKPSPEFFTAPLDALGRGGTERAGGRRRPGRRHRRRSRCRRGHGAGPQRQGRPPPAGRRSRAGRGHRQRRRPARTAPRVRSATTPGLKISTERGIVNLLAADLDNDRSSGHTSTTVDDLWSPAAAARCGLTAGAAWAVSGMGHLRPARVSTSDQQPAGSGRRAGAPAATSIPGRLGARADRRTGAPRR